MIIVNLKGGLGNQMFQYACGRALALRQAARGTGDGILKLNALGYETAAHSDTPRTYELGGWNVQESFAGTDEVNRIKYPFGIISKATRWFRTKILRRHYIGFNRHILSLTGSVYLDGFFQDERYFADVADHIRADFTPRSALSPTSSQLLSQINQDERSVSLHVRRGDYATTASAEFITLPPSYYTEALAQIPHPHVYVFSDDITWARQNLTLPADTIFVSQTGTPLFEELVLMSACRSHIIANSTFSWWGAWLDSRPDKRVIAPKQWSRTHSSWYKDIIPPTWTRL